MRYKFWCLILISVLFLGCQNNRMLEGNYSMCDNGIYLEVYFKQDSMRIASENKRVKLSEWKKIKVENDTLYFETFGEWRLNSKAVIELITENEIKLYSPSTEMKMHLNRIKEPLNFKNQNDFWKNFNDRKNLNNCN